MNSSTDSLMLLAQIVLGIGIIVFAVVRQLGTRRISPQRLVIMPVVFVVLAMVTDRDFVHRMTVEPLGWVVLVLGILVGAGFGVVRAATMSVRMEGATLITTGGWKTAAGWAASLAVHFLLIWIGTLLGVTSGTADSLLFVAATFAVQNLILASRAGLFKTLTKA